MIDAVNHIQKIGGLLYIYDIELWLNQLLNYG